jgi:hypothetical protein
LLLSTGVFVLLASGCSGGSDDPQSLNVSNSSAPVRERLDCGSSKSGSEGALRQFFAVLRRGNRPEVRSVLVDAPRFFALSVNGDGNRGPHVNARGDPDRAARIVAKRGGLPLTIAHFMNSERPHRTTDFGFRGRWNRTRHVIGKAAIDCTEGRAIVLGVGVRRR